MSDELTLLPDGQEQTLETLITPLTPMAEVNNAEFLTTVFTDLQPAVIANSGGDDVSAFTIESPDISKVFLALRARYALHGYGLHCQRQIEGVDQFYAERNRKVHHLPSLDEALRFLAVGSALAAQAVEKAEHGVKVHTAIKEALKPLVGIIAVDCTPEVTPCPAPQ
jgi:hypothetical protein